MTLPEVLEIALSAYDEDDTEREAILAALVPVVLGDRELLRGAIERAWSGYSYADGPRADEIRAAIAQYQTERVELDAEIAAAEAEEGEQ